MKPGVWWKTRRDKGNVLIGTLVQLSRSIYNEGCISSKREDNAYRLMHRAFCARIPP